MNMHFKLGLYEHQSASAIHGLIDILAENTQEIIKDVSEIDRITIKAYEPAYSIIGDPAKKDPRIRHSADHSMVYIVASLLRKAFEKQNKLIEVEENKPEEFWKHLMMLPTDYSHNAIFNETTRTLMQKIEFEHGGEEYD